MGSGQRCSFRDVVLQGCGFVPFRSMSAGFKDTPPGNAASVVAQHGPYLPRTACAQQFRYIAVGDGGPGRHQPNDSQHRLHILNPH